MKIVSSYYSTAQLEAMRKAKLKAELMENINKIRAQLLEGHKNSVVASGSSNMEVTVTNDDEGVSGFICKVRIGEALRDEQAAPSRTVLDLSSLLEENHIFSSQLEQEIEKLVDSIDDRAVLTEQDALDKERVLLETSKTLSNQKMDIEDKLKYLKMRIQSYIQGGTPCSKVDYQKLENEYYEYCALCQLVGEEPVETLPEKVSSTTKRLMAVAEKQKQDAYIMSTIEEIMNKLGCSLKDHVVLDHTEGQLFSVDGQPLCDVFVGADDSGIMFEPIAKTKEGSLDQKRALEASANSVCSMYREVEELALEKGIIFNHIYVEPASMDTICSQNDLQDSKKNKQQKKARKSELKARTTED